MERTNPPCPRVFRKCLSVCRTRESSYRIPETSNWSFCRNCSTVATSLQSWDCERNNSRAAWIQVSLGILLPCLRRPARSRLSSQSFISTDSLQVTFSVCSARVGLEAGAGCEGIWGSTAAAIRSLVARGCSDRTKGGSWKVVAGSWFLEAGSLTGRSLVLVNIDCERGFLASTLDIAGYR